MKTQKMEKVIKLINLKKTWSCNNQEQKKRNCRNFLQMEILKELFKKITI